MDTIAKTWGDENEHGSSGHWAYYSFKNDEEQKYWNEEHRDDINKMYWRHYDFMSIPCAKCGKYSSLRASTSFLGNYSHPESCSKEQIKDFHPNEEMPDNLMTWRENGWFYIFFKETLSDSLEGQGTFKLRRIPTDTENLAQFSAAQQCVHADGWIHTVKKALSKALSFIRFGGLSRPASRR